MTEITVKSSKADRTQASDVDRRFESLLSPTDWNRLPRAIRKRFSTPIPVDGAKTYTGHVVSTTLSPAGLIIAKLASAVGSPLPKTQGATGPATVIVRNDSDIGGQIWTRVYTNRGAFPQVVHSAKRFSGPTGIEEYLGYRLTMRLALSHDRGALVFRSDGYDLALLGRRWRLPAWASPGTCTITHRDEGIAPSGKSRFAFILHLTHPWFGELIHQVAFFEDPSS